MPNKLKVLVGLLGLSILLAGISSSWIALVLNILLLVGVLRGSEGVRGLLIGLAILGLAGNAFVLIIATVALMRAVDLIGLAALVAGIIGAAQSAFFIWCLRQRDVQVWMFRRKMGDLDV